MQYSQETIEKLASIAEEKGEYVAVSNYLGITQSQLLTKRRQYPELDIALKAAVKKYKFKNHLSYKHKFTKEELEDITQLVKEKNVESAAKIYGGSADKLWIMRKSNPELEAAIIKGQTMRKGNTVFRQAMNLFGDFDTKQLAKVSKIAEEGGLEAVVKKYGFAANALNKCRQNILELDKAIKAGLRKRPIGAGVPSSKSKDKNKEIKTPKTYKKKGEFKKPPREIIDKTMLAVEENSSSALESFRKIVEERKVKDNLQKARKGYYSDMIGA